MLNHLKIVRGKKIAMSACLYVIEIPFLTYLTASFLTIFSTVSLSGVEQSVSEFEEGMDVCLYDDGMFV